jgi:hypothetical protein
LKILSDQALIDKGMNVYLKSIPDDLIAKRFKYGFMNKRSVGKIKYF